MFLIHISWLLLYIIMPDALFHKVLSEVRGLFAFHAFHHLTWLGGVGNHADGVVIADVFPEPVEQHHHLVLHAEDGAKVNNEPQNPCEEALAMELANLYNSLVTTDGCHRSEVVVFERSKAVVVSMSFVYSLDVLGKVLCLLYSHLSHLRMSVRISRVCGLKTLVADGKHVVQSRNTIKLVYFESEATS